MNPTILKYAAVVIAITAAAYGCYHHGVSTTTARYEAVIAKANAAHAKDLADKLAAARAEEQSKAADMHAIDTQTIQDKQNEIDSRDSTIADLRAGSLRLRDHFTCSAGSDKRLPDVAATAGKRDAARQGGLQQADAEFLVRLASDADQVARQLQACQAVVRSDRGHK
jgi:hypothetical protein